MDVVAANKYFIAAIWDAEKQLVRDEEKRDRCCGGMPSYCYSNHELDDAMKAARFSVEKNWNSLTATNRKFAANWASSFGGEGESEFNKSIVCHAIVGCSAPPDPPTEDARFNDAKPLMSKLADLREKKKEARKRDRRSKRQKREGGSSSPRSDEDGESSDEDSSSDYEEWESAGLGKWESP